MARIAKIIFSSLLLLSFTSNAQEDTSKSLAIEPKWVSPKEIFRDTALTKEEARMIIADEDLLKTVPSNFDEMAPREMIKYSNYLDYKIYEISKQRDSLLNTKINPHVIESKEITLSMLIKDKKIVDLSLIKDKLSNETGLLLSDRAKLKKYIQWAGIGFSIFVLVVLVLLQRYRIRSKNTEIINQLKALNKKNAYLEYAAKIIRHDMHSGINTYIPRGITSLERRLTHEIIETLKLESPLKILKEGLLHTQKVYKGVYEFTNLVKKDAQLEKTDCDIKKILHDYLSNTSYISQVILGNLPILSVNQPLFCTAVDNLIRNGLKYNDSPTKIVKVYEEDGDIIIEDNGRGMSHEDFVMLSQPYKRKEGQTETGTGLGLNICLAILQEHHFDVHCDKVPTGTKMRIIIKPQ